MTSNAAVHGDKVDRAVVVVVVDEVFYELPARRRHDFRRCRCAVASGRLRGRMRNAKLPRRRKGKRWRVYDSRLCHVT
jgi:hypothetical protein